MKKLLIIVASSPYGSIAARDAIDFIMSAGGYGHWIDVLFIDDGVHYIVPSSTAHTFTLKSTEKNIKSLPFFDVENTYVCTASVESRTLQDKINNDDFVFVNHSELNAMTDTYDMVVTF